MKMDKIVESRIQLIKKQLIGKLKTIYEQFATDDIIIWGTGTYGKFICRLLKSFNLTNNIKGFCNSFCKNEDTYLEGYKEYSPISAFKNYPKAVYIIASDFSEEILNYIKEKIGPGVLKTYVADNVTNLIEKNLITLEDRSNPENEIVFGISWFEKYRQIELTNELEKLKKDVFEILQDDKSKLILNNRISAFLTGDYSYIENLPFDAIQYFSENYYNISDKEVYFDCGAYTGDSLADFCKITNNKFNRIICFEPDINNYNTLVSFINKKKFRNLIVEQKAIGVKRDSLPFLNKSNMGSRITEDSNAAYKVNVVPLDDYFDYHPTLIKFDIEGFELEALKGSKKIITNLKPKLAICVYHKPMDVFEIPIFLHTLVPEYKFKFRHHTHGFPDTVLYAYC
ncbi:MAG: FkbM family methyltransferase [Succinivibrio sp.]|nr:FkbM family methyltransferase [Succinivibrio sp.]